MLQNIPLIPTPVSNQEPTNQTSGLSIVKTVPQDGTTNVPTTTSISVLFDRIPFAHEFSTTVNPQASFSAGLSGQTETFSFSPPLQPGTTYHYSFSFSSGPTKEYSFTTAGSGPATNAKQLPPNQAYTPESFVASNVPYKTQEFSVSSGQTSGSYVFYVLITTTSESAGKQKFIDWLYSIGLSTQQIKSLDIHYYLFDTT